MSTPAASIITATYNAERFIQRTIDTVLGQTYEDFEWVVMDDGSSDSTCAVLESQRDPRIRLHRQANRGPSAARNAAAAASRGPVVVLLDHDDIWFPGRLERLLGLLDDRPEIGFASTDMLVGDPAEPESAKTILENPDCTGLTLEDEALWVQGCGFSASTAAIRRRLLERHGGFDEDLWFVQDWEYALRFWLAGERPVMIPEVHGWTVMHAGQLSENPWGLYYDRRTVLTRVLSQGIAPSLRRLVRARLESLEREQVGIALAQAASLASSDPRGARARALWAMRRPMTAPEGAMALAYAVAPRAARMSHSAFLRLVGRA